MLSLPSTPDTVRGISAVTLLIEDEASRVDDELHHAVRPMLTTSNGRLMLMSTPFGRRGHFWEAWSGEGAWNRVTITANECPRITKKALEEERKALPGFVFEQEYLCNFAEDAVTSAFRHEDVMGAVTEDVLPLFGAVAA